MEATTSRSSYFSQGWEERSGAGRKKVLRSVKLREALRPFLCCQRAELLKNYKWSIFLCVFCVVEYTEAKDFILRLQSASCFSYRVYSCKLLYLSLIICLLITWIKIKVCFSSYVAILMCLRYLLKHTFPIQLPFLIDQLPTYFALSLSLFCFIDNKKSLQLP